MMKDYYLTVKINDSVLLDDRNIVFNTTGKNVYGKITSVALKFQLFHAKKKSFIPVLG